MNIVEMNEGRKVQYEVSGTRISFADEALSFDIARQQRDYENIRDIMAGADGSLNVGAGDYYVAQVVIPPIEYEETDAVHLAEGADGEDSARPERKALPLDMDKVELRLFCVDGIYIA